MENQPGGLLIACIHLENIFNTFQNILYDSWHKCTKHWKKKKKQRLKTILLHFRLSNLRQRTTWPNFWFHKRLWGNSYCFALVFLEQEPNVPEGTQWYHRPTAKLASAKRQAICRACRLCCEWAVNYQGDGCCLPGDRVARCLRSSETERCALFPPRFLFYTVTVAAWKQKWRTVSVVLGIMATQAPYGAEGVGLRLLSGAAEKSNVIRFHRNCLSSLCEN